MTTTLHVQLVLQNKFLEFDEKKFHQISISLILLGFRMFANNSGLLAGFSGNRCLLVVLPAMQFEWGLVESHGVAMPLTACLAHVGKLPFLTSPCQFVRQVQSVAAPAHLSELPSI